LNIEHGTLNPERGQRGGGRRIEDEEEDPPSLRSFGEAGENEDDLAYPIPIPPLDPQHPQQLGKYETKLRSDPQQSRNKGATGGATF